MGATRPSFETFKRDLDEFQQQLSAQEALSMVSPEQPLSQWGI